MTFGFRTWYLDSALMRYLKRCFENTSPGVLNLKGSNVSKITGTDYLDPEGVAYYSRKDYLVELVEHIVIFHFSNTNLGKTKNRLHTQQ